MSASIWSPDGTIPSDVPPDYVYKRVWLDIAIGQTLVDFASVDSTFVYTPGLQSLEVGIDGGMPLQPGVDYTETTTHSITLLAPATDAGRLYAAVGRPINVSPSGIDASLVPYTFPDGVVRSVQDLATSIGTTGLRHLAADTGATTQQLQAFLRKTVRLSGFAGYDPTGVTDSSAAFANAFAYLGAAGGTVEVDNGAVVKITQDVPVPTNCFIRGPKPMGAIEVPVTQLKTLGRIELSTAATFLLGNNTGVSNLLVISSAVLGGFNMSRAQVEAGFTGRAFTFVSETSDQLITDCCVLGFDTFAGTTGTAVSSKRPKIYRCIADCLNGAYLHNCLDFAFLYDIQCRPLCSFNATPEANTNQLKRSGAQVRLDGTSEYCTVLACKGYGWMAGFQTDGGGGHTIAFCDSDHPPGTTDNSVGFTIGASYFMSLVGCKSSAKDIGLVHNNTDLNSSTVVTGFTSWRNVVGGINNKAGNLFLTTPALHGASPGSSPTAAYGVYTENTAGRTRINGGNITGLAIGSKADSTGAKVLINNVDFENCTTNITNPFLPGVAATNPGVNGELRIDGDSNIYSVSGGNAYVIYKPDMYVGRPLTLIFPAGGQTLFDGTGNMKLNGNFVATADDSITLISDGTFFIELCRSAN